MGLRCSCGSRASGLLIALICAQRPYQVRWIPLSRRVRWQIYHARHSAGSYGDFLRLYCNGRDARTMRRAHAYRVAEEVREQIAQAREQVAG